MTDNLHATAGPVERPELPRMLTPEEIHSATTKVLADPELHRFFDWSVYAAREAGRMFARHEAAAPVPGSAGWAVPNRQAEDDRSQFDKAAEKLREAFDAKDRPVPSDPVVRPANDVAQEPSGAKGAVPVSPEDSEDAVVRLVSSRILRLQLEIEEADAVDSGISRIESAQKEVAELRSWLNRHPAPATERRFTLEDKAALMYAADLASFWGDGKNLRPVFSRHGAKGVAERLRRMLDEATERP